MEKYFNIQWPHAHQSMATHALNNSSIWTMVIEAFKPPFDQTITLIYTHRFIRASDERHATSTSVTKPKSRAMGLSVSVSVMLLCGLLAIAVRKLV